MASAELSRRARLSSHASGTSDVTPCRPSCRSPRRTAARLGGNRACLAVARKLLKRSYHTLRELGQEALQPA